MIIIEKLIDSLYECLVILVKFIPIAIVTTVIKMLVNLKNKTEKDFIDILLEFAISFLLSCVIGYLTFIYIGEKQAIILTAIIAWSGSKITNQIDTWIGNYIKQYKNDKNDTNS